MRGCLYLDWENFSHVLTYLGQSRIPKVESKEQRNLEFIGWKINPMVSHYPFKWEDEIAIVKDRNQPRNIF